MRTIIAGSRVATWKDVQAALDKCPFTSKISVVLSGCARGADLCGEKWAISSGIPISRFPAEWSRLGRKAGVFRNTLMANSADALIAVWDGNSSGTANMIHQARQKNLRVFVFKFVSEEINAKGFPKQEKANPLLD